MIDAEPRPGRYRHFKGGLYEVVDHARHSETQEWLVVYRALYGDGGLWVRPRAMFLESVEHQGVRVPRFARIEDSPESADSLDESKKLG